MKDKLIWVVIIGIGAFVLFQKGCFTDHQGAKGPDTLVVHDTTWQVHEKTIVKEVPFIKEIPVSHEVLVTKYQADTSYPGLKKQYDELAKKYASRRVYQDSVKVGTHGYIHITDTVSENKLGKRTTKDNFKIPIVKETMTITKYAPPTRNIFVGGGVNGTSASKVNGAEAGLLYKDKKDNIFGGKINVSTEGTVGFGFSYYYKIK
jgi:hypothetical protein